jgi:hypothetical protein
MCCRRPARVLNFGSLRRGSLINARVAGHCVTV